MPNIWYKAKPNYVELYIPRYIWPGSTQACTTAMRTGQILEMIHKNSWSGKWVDTNKSASISKPLWFSLNWVRNRFLFITFLTLFIFKFNLWLHSKKDTNKMVEEMVLSIRFKFRINMPLDSNNTTNLLEEMRKIDPYG
jgi:hypothetical protein